MRTFSRGATFLFFNLKNVMMDRPKLIAEGFKGAFDLLGRGITRPILPLTVYNITDVEKGFRTMQSGNHKGKIAFTWSLENTALRGLGGSTSLRRDGKMTYILVGGFGGLGRSLSKLLVELGARHLCFISRSRCQSPSSIGLLQKLRAKSVRTAVYTCDVTNEEQLSETLSKCSQEMSRIAGVIQCAMVLRDALFERMTWEEWNESLRPKVLGSWNLHVQLPSKIDFFIILSSFSGVFSNIGQSNYAAGGAYQDALAHHRRLMGLKATTIDLGIIKDVGVLAEQARPTQGHLKDWEPHFGM